MASRANHGSIGSSLPKVQAVLQAKFKGNPITENNLSQWKNGGFPAWEAGEQMADSVSSIIQGTTALQAVAKGGLTDRMALLLAANIALRSTSHYKSVQVNISEYN